MSTKQEPTHDDKAQTGHSPTPWAEHDDEIFTDAEGCTVRLCNPMESEAAKNRKFVLRAVNAFDDLVAVAEKIAEVAHPTSPLGAEARAALNKARQA